MRIMRISKASLKTFSPMKRFTVVSTMLSLVWYGSPIVPLRILVIESFEGSIYHSLSQVFHVIQSVQISPDGSRSFHMFPDDHVELLSGEGHSFATQHLTTIPDCVPSRVATCPTLHCLGGRVQSVAEPRVRASVQSSRRLPFVGLVYLT